MMSRTDKAEEVRSYFLALEDHINIKVILLMD